MSHSIDKIKQHRSKRVNKSGESTSNTNAQSQTEGDSRLHRSQCITNTPIVAGTFTLLIASLFLPAIVGIDAYADDSITVTLSGNPTITVAPTTEGTFADSGDITIGVTSSSSSGYTLSITGTDNTSLVGKTDNTKSIASIPTGSALSAEAFNTSTYNNMWGYKPSMYYNTSTEQRSSNSSYLPSPGSSGDIIDITDDSSSNDYTMSIGARVTNTLGFQTYENNAFTIAAVGNVTTDNLIINYDANGGYFGNDTSKTVNSVAYDATAGRSMLTKYSHTSNLDDQGVASGTYSGGQTAKDTVTILGASDLDITIYYSTEDNWDYVYIFQGEYTGSVTRNMSAGQLKTYNGGKKTAFANATKDTFTVSGDTATFAFYSDNAGNYYGYYAIITGEGTAYSKAAASGAYATPFLSGYAKLLGWSTDKDATVPTYTTEAEISANLQAVNGDAPITLYAIWTNYSCTDTISGITYMQDIASSNKPTVLAAMDIDKQYSLKDKRDEKPYCVAKLQDGNIWMTQNLDLDLDSTKELKHADTDLGWGTDAATTTWTPVRSTIDATGGTISNWTDDNNTPYSVNPGDWYWIGNPFYKPASSSGCNYLASCTDKFAKTADYNTHGTHGHVGNYYNWSAAVASNNTSSYASNASTNIANSPQNSICPAGWRLPTAYGTTTSNAATTDDAKNEFYALNKLYNSGSTSTSQGLEAAPLFFVRGGNIGGQLYNSGYSGTYLSSTTYSDTYAYTMPFNDAYVGPAVYNLRSSGGSIRCLVR